MGSGIGSGLSPFGQNAASTIRDSREREKKDLGDLNDRLASYIEKVRFLEAQNRKLATDLDALRSKWGKDTHNVKNMYERELGDAQKLIEDTHKQRKELEGQVKKMQDELTDIKKKYEDAVRGRSTDRAKIDELLRRIAQLEEEVKRIKSENQRLLSELQRARTDLDQETLNRIDNQNQVQTLLEEIDFLRRVQDQEIKELQMLAARDTTPENREYFKNELSSAIREIRDEYDQLSNVHRNDMESWYRLKVQEIQTQSARQTMEQGYAKEEVKRLRSQLTDLRGKLADLEGRNSLLEKQIQELNYQLEDDQRSYEAALNDRDAQIRKMREECQSLMVELQMLLDTKQTLDAEIAIYRKMLEGEENRAGLKQLVEQVVKTHGIQQEVDTETMRVVKGETASRQSFQRSAKGNVSIHEASPDGKYIVLQNTHRAKDEGIGEWKLKRKIDGKKEIVYTLPVNFVLRAGKQVKIFAKNQAFPPRLINSSLMERILSELEALSTQFSTVKMERNVPLTSNALDRLGKPLSQKQTWNGSSIWLTSPSLQAFVASFFSQSQFPEITNKLWTEKLKLQSTLFGSTITFFSRAKRQIYDGVCKGCGPLACPYGPPGPPGFSGSDGIPGEAGNQGTAGDDGTDVQLDAEPEMPCVVCPSGPTGPRGAQGERGRQGGAGPGLAGDAGEAGDKGPEGPTGQPGKTTVAGIGIKGPKGPPGPSGMMGPPGPGGETGPPGASGPMGAAGRQGHPGNEGPYGPPGDAGMPASYCPRMEILKKNDENKVDDNHYYGGPAGDGTSGYGRRRMMGLMTHLVSQPFRLPVEEDNGGWAYDMR
ncbi:unnamed protein product, partial [Mesorhabditis belari]|uniref:Uncharacterized protein n=1 Tax=Mesorhabditis belari TaxID=2138241 RepID=A0AAF3FP47_9BILA